MNEKNKLKCLLHLFFNRSCHVFFFSFPFETFSVIKSLTGLAVKSNTQNIVKIYYLGLE